MIRPIAVLDTNVLIMLLDTTNTSAANDRRTLCELTIQRLEKQRARFIVPAPVVAELGRTGRGSDVIRQVVRTMLTTLRVEVLDEDAADIAGEIARIRLQNRVGRERGAVKYDALIAGIAQRVGARWLVTADPDDMRQHLAAINSSIEVVVADQPPASGQLAMVAVMRPGG